MSKVFVGVVLLIGTSYPSSAQTPRMVGASRRVKGDHAVVLRPKSQAQAAGDRDAAPPGSLPVGSQAAADRQAFVSQAAAKAFADGNRLPADPSMTAMALTPKMDPATGLTTSQAAALTAEIHNQTVVDKDAFGPIGPGRRDRIAEAAGLSPEEARKLWPYPDPKPFKQGDMAAAERTLTDPKGSFHLTQEQVEQALKPGQLDDREDMIKHAVLTDQEASFAVYAALGLPFPIRVGKMDTAGLSSQGLVIFSPELMRADEVSEAFTSRLVTYRWMYQEREVEKGTLEVRPFAVLRLPSQPVTHLWITCDQDVMVYGLRGVQSPMTISQARDQIKQFVVPANSWLRQPTKLYGIRWAVLPKLDELATNPTTKAKLVAVLQMTGLGRDDSKKPDEIRDLYRTMADFRKQLPPQHAPPVGNPAAADPYSEK